MHEVQKRGGIHMILPFQFCMKKVLVKFPIAFIVGDTIGNDKLCSRFQNYVPTQAENTGVSRDCTCTYKHAGNHNYKCCMLSRITIKSLPSDVSRRLGFNKSSFNAFDDMSFGSSRHGINGHTPPEMLHQWYLGVVSMFIKYFLEHLTTKCKDSLDLIIQNMARMNCRQSDRSLPNIGLFRHGVDKVKLTGSEKGNQLFMLWLALIPKDHGQFLINTELKAPQKYKIVTSDNKNVRTERIYVPKILDNWRKYRCWVNIFESMLSIGEWLRSSSVSIDRNDIEPCHDIELYVLHGYDAWQNNLVSSSHHEKRKDKRVIDFSEVEVHDTTSCTSTIKSFQDPNVFSDHDVFNYEKTTIKVSRAEIGIRVFMKQCREVINREDSFILKNGKFHQLLHYTYYINVFGSPANFDGSIPESMNKEFAKNTGKRTQQRNETINQQCAERFYENNIIHSSLSKIHISQTCRLLKSTEQKMKFEHQYDVSGAYTFTFKVDNKFWTHTSLNQSSFSQYVLTKSKYISIGCDANMLNFNFSKKIRINLMKTLILTLIRNNVITKNLVECKEVMKHMSQLRCYSHVKLMENLTIHSALEYYSEDNWMDWILVNWGDEGGALPCKVLCVFDSRNIIDSIQKNSQEKLHYSPYISSLLECSIWCLVRSASNVLSQSKIKSTTLFSTHKMTDELSVVTIDSVICGTYVLDMTNYYVANDSPQKEEAIMNRLFNMNMCSEIISIRNRDDWCTTFMEKCEQFLDRFKRYVESD